MENDDADPLCEIRNYLTRTSCYDAMPESITTLILDSNLLLTKGAEALITHSLLGIPVMEDGFFKALLGTNDILLLMHYFYHNQSKADSNEMLKSFRVGDVFKLERPQGLQYLDMSVHPDVSILTAAKLMLEHNQFRAAVLDVEPAANCPKIKNFRADGSINLPGHHCILSVITNYRIIRAVARNCNVDKLMVPAKQLMSIPQYTATMDTPIINVVEMLIGSGVNAIPILDKSGHVINIYSSPDILYFVADHDELNLNITIEHALKRRSNNFEGVHTCKEIDNLGHLLRGFQSQSVHRILVVDDNLKLLGILRLVDIVRFLVYQDL